MDVNAFVILDVQRRALGRVLEAAGGEYAPDSGAAWAARPGFTLRSYGDAGPPVLCVPAPIKGPEVWHMHPETSAVRRLERAGRRPFVLEWGPPAARAVGLNGHVALVAQAADLIAAETGAAPLVIGHSLGGTLAALAAVRVPDTMAALVLLESPLAFAAPWERLAQYRVDLRHAPMETVPGSVLDLLAIAALPERFVLDPAVDGMETGRDADDRARHLRERRWTLDEVPMPVPLFADLADLCVAGPVLRPEKLAPPVLSVIDPDGDLVDPAATLALHAALPDRRSQVHVHVPGRCVLRHLEPVVGRTAHATLWPEIERWTGAVCPAMA